MNIVVVGPPYSGATSLVAAVAAYLPGHCVLEAGGVGSDDAIAVVVFVVSAAAPLTRSDALLLDAAAERTDAVIAAVSKIDVHRTWRDVLGANQAALSGHGTRYRYVPWVGVAAAPDVGAAAVDDLVELIHTVVASGGLDRRNALRARCSQLAGRIADFHREERRRDSQRKRQRARIESAQARVELVGWARAMCAALRVEFHQVPARQLGRKGREAFQLDVQHRAARLSDHLDCELTRRLGPASRDGAAVPETRRQPGVAPGWSELVLPALRPAGPEHRLSILVGVGFGLGTAATLDRLVAEFAPGWTTAAGPGCLAVGVVVGVSVVYLRRAIAARAALDRWLTEVTAALRTTFEERIAARFLVAETALRVGAEESVAERGAVTGTLRKELIRELASVRRRLGDQP